MQQAKRSTHSSSSSSSSEETKQKKEDMCQLHDVEKMIRIFMESDDNKDGVVTKEELVKNYRKLGLKKEQVDVSLASDSCSSFLSVHACMPVLSKFVGYRISYLPQFLALIM